MYFGNAANLGEKMRAVIARENPKVVLFDCGAVPGFEFTALRMLVEAEALFRGAGIELWLAALNPEALEMVRRTRLGDALGRERMFFTVEDAIEAYSKRSGA